MYKKLALALAVTALTACGGGGSNSGDDNNGGGSSSSSSSSSGGGTSSSSSSSSSSGGSSSSSSSSGGNGGPVPVGGTAAKGIISGAKVEAFSADNTPLGTSETAADGSYSIDLNGYAGPVKLVLSSPDEGVALVTCDAAECRTAGDQDQDSDSDGVIEFGEQYALDYTLRSVTFVDETATEVSASITALTTLVAEKAGTALTQASISAANAFVKETFGLDADPAAIAPVDLTSADNADEQQLRFALLNAAIEEAADGGDVAAQLQGLSAGFASNTVDAAALAAVTEAIANVATATSANNEGLGGVADAADAAQSDAEEAIADNCGESATCKPPVEIVGEDATNLDAAKALVATARKVSLEAVEAIEAELDEESDGYNTDNIVVKLKSAEALLDEDAQDVLNGFREVSDVFLNQISAVEFGAEPTLQAPYASLTDAAGYLWQKYGLDTDYGSQTDIESHFPAGTISREEFVWTLSGGIYDIDGDASTTADQVAVELQINLAALSGELGSFALSAGENVFTIEGTAVRDDVALSLTDASQVKLNLAESFAEDSEGEPNINSLSLMVDGGLENANHAFTGTIEFGVKKSTALASEAAENEHLSLLPEKLLLSGAFSDKQNATSLEALVSLNIDNVGEFSYLPEGTERDDLTTYTYDAGSNTLTLVHGLAGNQATVTYSHYAEDLGGYYEHYVDVSCVTEGEAYCPATGLYSVWGVNTVVSEATDPATCESDPHWGWWEYESGQCIRGVSPDEAGVAQDIRVVFTADYEYLLSTVDAYVPAEGWYAPGPQDWWDEGYWTQSVFGEAASGILTAYLDEADFDVDAEGRYLKATARLKASGKLSASLPEMDVELVIKRTGFEMADVALTLSWGSDLLRIDIDYTGEDLSEATLTDGTGAAFMIEFADSDEDDTLRGYITKDGTIYGTLSKENDIYLITWIDNAIETLL